MCLKFEYLCVNITYRKTDKTLMCTKDKASNVATATMAKDIKVIFDNAERLFHGKQFTFYPDPVVTMIKPLQTFRR